MGYFKAFGYISYVVELLTLAASYRQYSPAALTARASDIIYRAVDYGLAGKASRTIDRLKLTDAVSRVVEVILDVMD